MAYIRTVSSLLLLAAMAGSALLMWPGQAAAARFTTVPGASGASGPGRVVRFTVEVERGIREPGWRVARDVERHMFDHRSWGASGRRSFQRVSSGRVDLHILLARPATTDRLCAPLPTAGVWNCAHGRTVVMNLDRWMRGRATYAGHQDEYRALILMHEYGHVLGHGHAGCPGRGRLAPPMMQQGKGLDGCRRNPWPYPTAPRPRTRCFMRVESTTSPNFVRVVGSVRYVGRPLVVSFQARVAGRWQHVGARRSDPSGRITHLVRTDAAFLRMRFEGTPSRRACAALASRSAST